MVIGCCIAVPSVLLLSSLLITPPLITYISQNIGPPESETVDCLPPLVSRYPVSCIPSNSSDCPKQIFAYYKYIPKPKNCLPPLVSRHPVSCIPSNSRDCPKQIFFYYKYVPQSKDSSVLGFYVNVNLTVSILYNNYKIIIRNQFFKIGVESIIMRSFMPLSVMKSDNILILIKSRIIYQISFFTNH